jgi:hypothetical protein
LHDLHHGCNDPVNVLHFEATDTSGCGYWELPQGEKRSKLHSSPTKDGSTRDLQITGFLAKLRCNLNNHIIKINHRRIESCLVKSPEAQAPTHSKEVVACANKRLIVATSSRKGRDTSLMQLVAN